MKPCPFCAEQIQDAAIKCRWCRETLVEQPDLTDASPSTTSGERSLSAPASEPRLFAKGYSGDLALGDTYVEIRRSGGFMDKAARVNRAVWGGEGAWETRRIPLAVVGSVEFKEAGPLEAGYLKIVERKRDGFPRASKRGVPGMRAYSRLIPGAGGDLLRTANDGNAVTFRLAQQSAFIALAEELEARLRSIRAAEAASAMAAASDGPRSADQVTQASAAARPALGSAELNDPVLAAKVESSPGFARTRAVLPGSQMMAIWRRLQAGMGKLSSRESRLSVLYVAGGVVFILSPLLPGLTLTLVPALSPQDWSRTVSMLYFESIVPLLLPLAGLGLVVVGTRWPEARRPGLRGAVAFFLGATGAAVGAWSASSLNQFGGLVTSDFGGLTFSRTIHVTFNLVATWIVIVVGAWIALAIAHALRRRLPCVVLLVSLLALGGVLGVVAGPLPSSEHLIQRASSEVADAEATFREQKSREWSADHASGPTALSGPCDGIRRGDVCVDQTLCELLLGSAVLLGVANDPETYASGAIDAMNLLGSERSRQMGVRAVYGIVSAYGTGGQEAARSLAYSYTGSLCSDAQFFRDLAMTYPA